MADRFASIEFGRIARSAAQHLGSGLILWALFQFLWVSFPYVRNGTRVILDAKKQVIEAGEVFPQETNATYRVAVFGESRILCGFLPEQFDAANGGRTVSYNLGMPGDPAFVRNLEIMIERGSVPTHVFLLVPWPRDEFEPTVWKWFQSDDEIMERIFPFRTMPRDLFVFFALARTRGGVEAFYQQSRQYAVTMLADRGYFFIEGQSLFPDHRLPDDYSRPEDSDAPHVRTVVAEGPYFQRLQRLVRDYGLRIYLIPGYVRDRAYGPPSLANEQATRKELEPHPGFCVLGPDYFRYPNSLFSDNVHVNPDGARRYTQDLWNVTHALFEDRQANREEVGSWIRASAQRKVKPMVGGHALRLLTSSVRNTEN